MSGAALYLHLCALELLMRLKPQPTHPDGYVIGVQGVQAAEPLARERAQRQILADRAALASLLASGSPEALAVAGARQCTPVLRGVALWESLGHGTDR